MRATEACRRADITYRQLDYWRRQGAFGDRHRTLGSGGRDEWSDREVLALVQIGRLSRALSELGGVSGQGASIPFRLVREVFDSLLTTHGWSAEKGPVRIELAL